MQYLVKMFGAAALALPLQALAASAFAFEYVAHEIRGDQGQSVYAQALNDRGWVVGRTDARLRPRVAEAFFASPQAFKSRAVFGADFSFAQAINHAGDIAGHYQLDKNTYGPRAFLKRRGQPLLDLFAAGWIGHAGGINRHGTVVGAALPAGTANFQAFVWQDGQVTLLTNTLGGDRSDANAVNDDGVVVGSATDADGALRAFRHENGEMIALPSLAPLGALGDVAEAINAAGDVAGSCEAPSLYHHACVWKGDAVVDLGTLPRAIWSQAYGINGAGVAVGRSGGEGHSAHAVVFRDGRVLNLNQLTQLPPGVHLDLAISINEAGQIIVQGKDADRARHSYLLVPVLAH